MKARSHLNWQQYELNGTLKLNTTKIFKLRKLLLSITSENYDVRYEYEILFLPNKSWVLNFPLKFPMVCLL